MHTVETAFDTDTGREMRHDVITPGLTPKFAHNTTGVPNIRSVILPRRLHYRASNGLNMTNDGGYGLS
jgi:hypothetical protein